MKPGTRSRFYAYTVVFIVVFLWGSAFTAIKIGLEHFGSGELAFLRFFSASVFSLILFTRQMRLPAGRDLPTLVVVSLFGITGYHLLLNFGQQVVPPGTASLLVQTVPVWTAVIATIVGYEKIHAREWLGVAIAFIGTATIILGQGKSVDFSGSALLVLIAAFSTAIYFVFGRPLTHVYGSTPFTVWSIWIGTIPMVVFAPSAWQQIQSAEWSGIYAVLYLGIFPTVIAYALWMRGIQKIGASRTAFLLFLSPVFAILTAWVWYGIIPSVASFIGGSIAIGGVTIINSRRR
jgi:drug/metabolite transporter (DMT)-like permease